MKDDLPLVFSLEISLVFNRDGKLWTSLGDEVVFIVFGVVGLYVVTVSYNIEIGFTNKLPTRDRFSFSLLMAILPERKFKNVFLLLFT